MDVSRLPCTGLCVDLHEEIIHQERIGMQHQTTGVPYHLAENAHAHDCRVFPCLAADAEPGLGEQEQDEAGHVHGVAGNVGSVLDHLPCLGALADAAVFAGHGDGQGVGGGYVDVVGVDAILIKGSGEQSMDGGMHVRGLGMSWSSMVTYLDIQRRRENGARSLERNLVLLLNAVLLMLEKTMAMCYLIYNIRLSHYPGPQGLADCGC